MPSSNDISIATSMLISEAAAIFYNSQFTASSLSSSEVIKSSFEHLLLALIRPTSLSAKEADWIRNLLKTLSHRG